MPGLQKSILIELNELPNPIQFSTRKPTAFLQSHWYKPKLSDLVLALDMHMSRFITISCIKEKAIRT